MDIKKLMPGLAVSQQIAASDLQAIKAAGFRAIVCNRPDGEGSDQPNFSEIEAAAREQGIEAHYLPVESGKVGKVGDAEAALFGELMQALPKPVLAYCRTGMRAATLWALSEASSRTLPDIIAAGNAAGYDLSALARRIVNGGKVPVEVAVASHDIVIIGAGAAGIAVASSLLARDRNLDIAIIDPADVHYYQPGWTMVGAGVFDPGTTAREMVAVLPRKVHWIKAAVAAFEPEKNSVVLEGCRVVSYRQLIVCPGLKLDWNAVEGLQDTLGQNGVTSNYRYDLAPYT
jgi:sulfide:quinone oxidoreductase